MLFALFLVFVPPAALLAVELSREAREPAGRRRPPPALRRGLRRRDRAACAREPVGALRPGALVVAAAVGLLGALLYQRVRTGRLVPDGAGACSARVPGALPVRLERFEARVRQDAVRRRAARALADAGRARRLRRVRARLADGRRRAGERGAVSELRGARARLDLVPERDDRPVADRAGRARGAHRDPAADAPQPPADLRRPPAQRLHAPRQELPSAGDRVDHAALPSLALQERPGQLECSRLGQDGLACLGCRDRLPAPAAAPALLGRDPGHRRQLGRLRPARGPRARATSKAAGESRRAAGTSAASRPCSAATASRPCTSSTRCCRTCRTSTCRPVDGTASRRPRSTGSGTTSRRASGRRSRRTSASCSRSSSRTAPSA